MGEDALRCLSFALLALIAGCEAEQPADINRVWRANEVITNIDALNGKTIKVGGYLGVCKGDDCGLFQDRKHLDEVDRWLASARSGKHSGKVPDWLGIGYSSEFDAKAIPFNNSYVLIMAKVSNQCRSHGKPVCTDRAPDLMPLNISRWEFPATASGSSQ